MMVNMYTQACNELPDELGLSIVGELINRVEMPC